MARDQIFVKPLGGAKIRKPDTKEYLKDDGEELERSSFWVRRQMAGEVSISKITPVVDEPEAAEEEAEKTAPPKAEAAAGKKKTKAKAGE